MIVNALRIVPILALLCVLAWSEARAQPAPLDKAVKANEILQQTLELFRKNKSLRFTVYASEERIFKDMVPLNFVFEYTVNVLDRKQLKISLPRPDGVSELYLDDGIITYYDKTRNIYTQGDFYGTATELIDVLRNDFELTLPGIDLVNPELNKTLHMLISQALYVGREVLPGGSAHHLAFFNDMFDWQLWVYEDSGLPGYLIITYKGIPGMPQTHLSYRGWDLTPDFTEKDFQFSPRGGAEKFDMQPSRGAPQP